MMGLFTDLRAFWAALSPAKSPPVAAPDLLEQRGPPVVETGVGTVAGVAAVPSRPRDPAPPAVSQFPASTEGGKRDIPTPSPGEGRGVSSPTSTPPPPAPASAPAPAGGIGGGRSGGEVVMRSPGGYGRLLPSADTASLVLPGHAPEPLGVVVDLPAAASAPALPPKPTGRWSVPAAPLALRTLSAADFAAAAKALGVDTATVRAVAAVESAGSGFLPDGRPTVLYEAHVFHGLTKGAHAGARDRYGVPLSVLKWNKALYGAGGAHQHERLADAAALDAPAAIRATSWGMFQILGLNHALAGSSTPSAFMGAMGSGAPAHLAAFLAFLRASGLVDELQRRDWVGFARGYNGAGYAANRYDEKLAAAYARAKAIG